MVQSERIIVTKLCKECIGKYKRNFDGRIAILFSGGKDSTMVAVATADAFPNSEIHLVCMDNGVSQYLGNSERQYREIERLFPKVHFIFKVLDIRNKMKKRVIYNIESDFLKKKFSSLLVCVGCKYLMHGEIATYALENDIQIVLDGFASRQIHYPEQTQEFMGKISEEYQQINIKYHSPIYNYFRDGDHIAKVLGEYGLLYVEQQPICLFGGSYSTSKPEEVLRYMEDFKKHNLFIN